jgi:hypothetical protein
MNIRSITIGINTNHLSSQAKLISKFIINTKSKLKRNNIRTFRIVTNFINSIEKNSPQNIYNIIKEINNLCEKNSIRWFCVPINVNLLESNKLDPYLVVHSNIFYKQNIGHSLYQYFYIP